MIKVNKSSCPDKFKTGLNPQSEGEIETKDTIEFFEDPANHELVYKKMGKDGLRTKGSYTVYKEARKALSKIFNGKCAYCESRVVSIYSGDVEHFRPKSGYNNSLQDALIRPGYYWLAADWNNLLFACPFCNQTNTHEIDDNGVIKEVVLGKLNQFPLVSEKYRLSHIHGSVYFSDITTYNSAFALEESERLLLNPCIDDIERFFKYNEEGAIMVNVGLSSYEQLKAETSIRVFALHRLSLAQFRREKLIQIKAQIRRVEIAAKNFNKYYNKSEEERTWFEGILREELIILKKYKDSNQEYSGLARYFIDQYFEQANLI